MFVALQLPLADARPFVEADTRKLEKPQFTLGFDFFRPEFMRSFGLLEPRWRDAPVDWPAEDVYCKAARGIRFAKSPAPIVEQPAGTVVPLACAFRRFLSNGETVSRIEIGLTRRRRRADVPLTPERLLDLARSCLRVTTRVRGASGSWQQQPFIDAGTLVAGHVLRSSTRWKGAPDDFVVTDWWVRPGRALAMIEVQDDELMGMPRDAKRVALDEDRFELYHLSFRREEGFARAWVLKIAAGVDDSALRDIRLHLCRLHAEREALRVMMRNLAEGLVPLPDDREDAAPLLAYLDKAAGFLERGSVYGHPQSELLETAYGYEDLVTAGQRASLRESLGRLRRSLADRLDRAAKASAPSEGGEYPL